MTTAANQILTAVYERLKAAEINVDEEVKLNDTFLKEAGIQNQVNTVMVSDDEYEDWSSLDSEGRSLEVDFYINTKMRNESVTEALEVAGQIESELGKDSSTFTIGGGHVLAERVTGEMQLSPESDSNLAFYQLQYTFLYRVKRADRNIIAS